MYLTFESYITHKEAESAGNPLVDFSKALEDIISNVIDNKFNIFRHFSENGIVHINIQYPQKLFSIKLDKKTYKKVEYLVVKIVKYNNWKGVDISEIENILNVIKESCVMVGGVFNYRIPISDMYSIIENIKIYDQSRKYNL